MWVYLCLWRLQPYDRNSELCPRHSRSLGKWKNSPPLQMWCPGEIKKKKKTVWVKRKNSLWQIRNKSFLQFYLRYWSTTVLWKINHILSWQELWLQTDKLTFEEQLSSGGGSGQRQSTHMDERCATDGKRNRRAKTHMYTTKQTHSCHRADELICKVKWAAGLRQ